MMIHVRFGFARLKYLARVLMFLIFLLPIFLSDVWAAVRDSHWEKAEELIKKGNFSSALAEISLSEERQANDPLRLKLQGICLMEIGQHDEAVLALREALAIEPESVSIRYFLAQSLAYRGSIVESIEQLHKVIEAAPHSEYAELAQGVLPDLQGLAGSSEAVPDINRWNLYLKVGAEYDDNVSARPEDDEDQTPRESWRAVYSAYGEIRFPDQKVDDVPFTFGIGGSVNGSYHEESVLDEHDLFSHTISSFLGRSGVWGEFPYDIRVQADCSHTELGGDSYSDIYGLGAHLQLQWTSAFLSTISFTYQKKDFENDSYYPEYYSRSGHDYQTGIAGYYYLLENRLILGLAYTFHWADPEGAYYELSSHNLSATVTAYLPWELRLFSSVSFRQEDYPEYDPDPPGRLDNIKSLYLSLSRPVYKDMVHLEVSYSYTTSDSDVGYAEYNQNIFGVALSCSL